jgi:glycosyltransferase involved in cell wall biosynthesis
VIRYPGVDLELFHPGDKAEARRRLGLGDGPVILCPRGLGAYLNSESVMDAAGAVCRLNRDAVFLFVSEVGEKLWPELKVRAIAAGAGERNLRHDGHVDWTAMPDYHRAADLMVSVSSNDSQPNCMLEAMACGTPVIMGDIEAIREWVAHEENGLLVTPGDAGELAASILRMLRDGRLAERFVPANLAKVRERVDCRVTCGQVKELALSAALRERDISRQEIAAAENVEARW